ncbi:phage portal protein [Streptomyces sp. KK5PA1]|uniref:Phage portal protein n=2 Tax=Actinacidiphila acididurans TaxID=2784346 RepID=A0ABS2U303_9ACTN|nr:phage portal protein [Actinacidiphila acididurans]
MDPQVAFGPGLPLIPAAIDPVRQDSSRPEPRFNEYPVSSNLPGVTDRLVPWKVLRDAAAAGGIPRRCIEIRKSDISTLDWAITITKDAVAQAEADNPSQSRADIEGDLRKSLGPEIGRCTAFWERPDPGQDEDWIEWVSKLLEEHLVLDALAIYPRRTYGGDLYAMEIIAGDTIKPLRDYRGGKPAPPNPAYQQMLWGFPRGEYTADAEADGTIPNGYPADTLIYKRRNVRASSPYGFSPVEQCLEDLDVWLRRRAWIRAEYTDGTVPAGLLRNTANNGWTPAQVLEYETALNDAWSGQTLERHRMRILPPGFELEPLADVAERYKPEYDLFLLKQLANHFSTTIAELNFTETGGLGSAGYHEGQSDIRERSATMPLYRWIQALITQISRRHLGMPSQLEFRILGLEEEDEAAADQVAQNRIQWGRMTLNEDRDRTGMPRYTFPEADKPMVMTTRGVIFLDGASQNAAPGQRLGLDGGNPTGQIQPGGQEADSAAADEDDDSGGDTADDGEDPGNNAGNSATDTAVKAELAAYHRWAKKNPSPRRPFTFTIVTKADAPIDLNTEHVIFAGGDTSPSGGDPVPKGEAADSWPGWDRDQDAADVWAARLQQALDGSVNTDQVAERWLAQQAGTAPDAEPADDAGDGDDQDDRTDAAVAAALAFLLAGGVSVTTALAPLLAGIWTEGWAIGAASVHAALGGTPAAFPWNIGDDAAARQTLTTAMNDALTAFLNGRRDTIPPIADRRLQALARVLARARVAGMTRQQLAQALRDALRDEPWARMTALTELTRAAAAAARTAYQDAGITQWRWVAEPGACPICTANAAAGPRTIGEAWPDGSDAPPAHPNCRCYPAPS